MPGRRKRTRKNLAIQGAELAFAVPQVVGHRLARMALAGPFPSASDRREFHTMGQEKARAFYQSWFAMGMAMMRMYQQGWFSMAQVLSAGLAPVHRRATANARRLGRTRLR